MSPSSRSELVARAIADDLWTMNEYEHFPDYFRSVFHRQLTEVRKFSAIYISEAEYGDIDDDYLESMIRWWIIDDQGFRDTHLPVSILQPHDMSQTLSGIYFTPYIRFYLSADRILIEERYGPLFSSRRRAICIIEDDSVLITSSRVIWTSCGS